jgi:hypothetical protein
VASAKDVADWMLSKLKDELILSQDIAVAEITLRFGDPFVYENQNGNLAIRQDVLRAFRKLTSTSVVWESGDKLWRFRESFDGPGRTADF